MVRLSVGLLTIQTFPVLRWVGCHARPTLSRMRKTLWAYRNFTGLHVWDNRRTLPQDAQKGQTSYPPNPGGYFTRPP